MDELRYGDLVTSGAHISEARGPYLVLHVIVLPTGSYAVCVSMDNDHTINIPLHAVRPFKISDAVLRIALARLEEGQC